MTQNDRKTLKRKMMLFKSINRQSRGACSWLQRQSYSVSNGAKQRCNYVIDASMSYSAPRGETEVGT